MKCNKCGHENKEKCVFCVNCGAKLAKESTDKSGFPKSIVISSIIIFTVIVVFFIIIIPGMLRKKKKPQEAGSKLINVDRELPDIKKKICKEIPNLEDTTIMSFDMDKDSIPEYISLVRGENPAQNNQIVILKSKGGKFQKEKTFNISPGYPGIEPTLVDLKGDESRQIVYNVASGGNGGFGESYILYFDNGFRISDTSQIGSYAITCEDLNGEPPCEIICKDFVACSTSNAEKVLIGRIYHWDGNGFQEVGSQFPQYYTNFIEKMKSQMNNSLDSRRGSSVEYCNDRTSGIIRAWKLGGFKESSLSAEETIPVYFRLVRDKEYPLAYTFLSRAWHEWQPYDQYVRGNMEAKFTKKVKNVVVKARKPDKVMIDVILSYYRQNCEYIRNEKLRYTLIKEDDIWKIDKGVLIGGNYYLQVGVFSKLGNAIKLKNQLQKMGYLTSIERFENKHNVLIGPYKKHKKAEQVVQNLKSKGYYSIIKSR